MLNNIWREQVFTWFEKDFSAHLLRSVDTYITAIFYNPETDRYMVYSKKNGYRETSVHIVKTENTGEQFTVIEATNVPYGEITQWDGFTVTIGKWKHGHEFTLEEEYNKVDI